LEFPLQNIDSFAVKKYYIFAHFLALRGGSGSYVITLPGASW